MICRCRRWPKGWHPTRNGKPRVRGEDWRIGDTVNASIGQGYVLTSPLQLAVMTARIATGRAVTPRLVRLDRRGRATLRRWAKALG